MIKTKIAIAALCLLALPGVTVFAGQGGFFELNADCKIEIVGEPEIGKEFEIKFTFTPLSELRHSKGIPDTARLGSNHDLTFIRGDSVWTGFLETGETYTLRATYRVDTALIFRPNAYVIAQQVLGPGTPYGDHGGVRATRRDGGQVINVNFDTSQKVILKAYDIDERDSSIRVIDEDTVSLDILPSFETKPMPDSIDIKSHKSLPQPDKKEFIPKDSGNIDSKQTHLINNGHNAIPASSGYYSIEGYASFMDNSYNIEECREVFVLLITYDFDLEDWIVSDSCYTNEYGYFYFYPVDNANAVVSMYSINPVTAVTYTKHHDFYPGDTLFLYSHFYQIYNPYYSDTIFPLEAMSVAHPDTAGAFNVLNTLLNGREYLSDQLNYSNLPLQNCTIWDALDGSRITSSFGGFGTGDNIPGIYIASKANDDNNWDEWDEGVILHEYGHYVMFNYMESIPDAGGFWTYLTPTIGLINLKTAMSEGWANFYSALVRDDPLFINTTYYDPQWIVHEYEISKPDPSYYSSQHDYPANHPWQTTPQWEGASVPGSINVSLWDIYDEFDDDNYMEGSYIWGHNNDHNSSCYWRGIDAIWDVLTNFDPQPDNPDHDYCWNIYEFIHGWRTFGYPVDSVFVNIFEAHGVAVFIPGDADNDKSVNVLDATCIINYLYKGLPAPEHLSAADINADCGVNLLDVTCLINYLYRGAPAPLVGCYNYYSS